LKRFASTAIIDRTFISPKPGSAGETVGEGLRRHGPSVQMRDASPPYSCITYDARSVTRRDIEPGVAMHRRLLLEDRLEVAAPRGVRGFERGRRAA